MTGRGQTEELNWPRWARVLLIALLVVLIANRMTMLVDTAAVRAGIYGEQTSTGGTLILAPQRESGYLLVSEVSPDGPLAKAGVRAGDQLVFTRGYEYLRRQAVGERLDFILNRGGVRSSGHLIVEQLPKDSPLGQQNSKRLLNVLAVIVSSLIGCFILWRGWGNQAAMMLGSALVTIGSAGINLPTWASAPWLAVPMWSINFVGIMLVGLLLPFAIRIYEDHAGPLARWWWRLAWIWFAVVAIYAAITACDVIALTNLLGPIGGPGIAPFFVAPGHIVAIAILVAGSRRSEGASRNRLALLATALTAYLIGGITTQASLLSSGSFVASDWLGYVNALVTGLLAPSLLAYAVLRHKLFDLGFAVNRTLVFGGVGVLLLVSFALIEWAIKQAIPKVWYGGSVYISALIAVGLYLAFNRLHHRVEHAIERVFFHKWQVNEAALKRFAAAAGHVEQPEALAGHFTTELARFTGGAAAALYARTAEGHYASVSGETVGADDLALAAMRAELGPIVPAEIGSPLEAALALPMMHQATLAGFVLLGPKPTGEDYRPDEIEVLGWATQQVGLDLQAIRVRELELSVVKLEARNANLSDVLAKAALVEA